ncbi:30S ribosomal protein S8 [Candidatus Woesearchaeota archaeon]|nr:MAG: 30S ribosomal protein S8 [Candidatus Woesearchaeota archaeon]
MALNDTLAAALSKINNAAKSQKTQVEIRPCSKIIKQVLAIMQDNHYVGAHTIREDAKGDTLVLNLIDQLNKCGAIKPRHAVAIDEYEKWEKRFLPAKGFGILLVSTNKGIMTHTQAKEQRLGGRLLAYCY